VSEPFIQRIGKFAADAKAKTSQPRKGETFVEVDQSKIRDFISRLVNEVHVLHLSTITGLDLGQNLGVIYHFTYERDWVHVRTLVPKTAPKTKSIVDIIPGAILYEMEIHDMFGLTFEGNPWINQKLLLPDIWPDDLPPPLLKSSKPAEIRKRLGLEVERK
jgi:NADH:ubiquinone oxidoreductase subunit C